MEWLDRMNDALAYLEGNLAGEIEMSEIARLACCSAYHFQRLFSYIAGVPLAEYIRRRRMTLAAFDLQNGARVVDVAFRYGYDSPTSFNRAFQSVHGIAPSKAQGQGVTLHAFPPISFQMTIKGVSKMEYRIEQKDAIRIVGARRAITMDFEQSFREVPQFWAEAAQDGTVERVAALCEGDPAGIWGVSTCNGEKQQNYYYIAAVSQQPVPEGMFEFTIPKCTWAIFPGEGPMPNSIQDIQKRIVTEWLPSSAYEWTQAPDIEVYLEPNPAKARFEVWLPIAKKSES